MGKQHAHAISFLVLLGGHSKTPFRTFSPSKATSVETLQESETITKMPSFTLTLVSVTRSSGEALDLIYIFVAQENKALSALLISS